MAVYFRGRRLASAVGHSIQQAEMNAAKKALEISHGTLLQICLRNVLNLNLYLCVFCRFIPAVGSSKACDCQKYEEAKAG